MERVAARLAVAAPTAACTRWCSRLRDLLGVDEVYAIGGAQAIAALALGTESVAPST